MKKLCTCFLASAVFIFLNIPFVQAQDISPDEWHTMKSEFDEMKCKIAALEEKVSSQQAELNQQKETKQAYEQRITDLENQLAQRPPTTAAQNSIRAAATKWTPEIGAVADVVATSTSSKEDVEGKNRLALRELELVLGSAVDPFSRLDATIAFSDEDDPNLEEAYLTRFGLPLDSTARIGKFKPKIGKILPAHRDSLDTVDEPLVIQRYFGSEGLSKSGVDFSKTLNLPIPVTQQIALGVLEGGNGEGGTAFGTTRRTPTVYSHLKNYMDLTDTTGLELGFSHMAGAGGVEPSFDVQVLGADLTLTQYLNATQSIKWQNEVFNLNRRESVDVDGNLWGANGLLDFRFHPSWSIGGRYDYVELVNHDPTVDPHNNDNGITGYLTFYQSELSRWRLQYSHTNLSTGKDDNTVYLQGTFAIGEHKHKLQ